MLQIKLEYLGRAHSQPEAERDDPPCGCASDEIEMIRDTNVEILFQVGKNGRRKHTANPSTVDCKYLKFMVYVHVDTVVDYW